MVHRVQNQRKIRDTILIITNGKKTEKLYFENLTKNFRSMFKIKVEYLNEQPNKLVEYAKSLDINLFNQIWCVFDIDDTYKDGHLKTAIEEANRSKINIAYSNEAFEVWLLYHLAEKVSPSLTRRSYIKEIDKLLKLNKFNNYQKNDENILKKVFIPNALEASERAKKIYQTYEADYQRTNCTNRDYPLWEWRSTTTVYQLIEALQLSKKNE